MLPRKPFSMFAAGAAFTLVLVGASHTLHADPPPTFAPGEALGAAKLNGAFASLSARLDVLERAKAVPPGTIIAYGGAVVPAGWRLCDGSSVNRNDVPDLFAAIGTAWGNGDGATTFNLPDLRGRFVRGVDRGAGRDPNRAARAVSAPGGNPGDDVGSVQDDSFQQHTHAYGYFTLTGIAYQPGGAGATVIAAGQSPQSGGANNSAGPENRPKNVNVNYIIKE